MPEKWSGDGTYYLPARQVAPYRLWFEFLKLAHDDPEISVDYDHYADWGPFWDMTFNEWWSGVRWRELFAIDAGVRVLEEGENIQSDEHALIVRLPLSKDPRETMKDVQELLEQHNAGVKFDAVTQGKFALSEGYEKGFLKYLNRVNLMSRVYRMWLKNADEGKKGQLDRTALEFYQWAKTRDDMIRERKYDLPRPLFPYAARELAESIINNEPDAIGENRRQFLRYVHKARKLAQNAAVGVFPGKY